MNTRKLWIISLVISFAGSILFTLALYLIRSPEWWTWILLEQTPMSWYQSLLLFLSAFLALLNAIWYLLHKKSNSAVWFLALGLLFAGLSIDERFTLHERIRDAFLAPGNIHIRLFFWMEKGDFLLFLLMLVGLGLTPFLLKQFQKGTPGRILFITAIGVAVLAVVLDSIPVPVENLSAHRIKEFWEEMTEMSAQLLFLNGLFSQFLLLHHPDNS